MDLPTTLARIVPTTPGTYLIVVYKTPRGITYRSFPADTGHLSAAALMERMSAQGFDTYFAISGFTAPRRLRTNVAGSRALYIDADVARPGDGKDPAKVFPDRKAAWTWLTRFTKGTGLPLPNVTIDSGYGYHWYWVLDEVLDLDRWQALADAFLAAMIAHGWTGDTAPTIDGARILRPPGLLNHKEPSTPAPTSVFTHVLFPSDDHPLKLIENSLQAYRNSTPTRPGSLSSGKTSAHRSVASSLGTPPAHVTPGVNQGLNAAAHANMGNLHEPHWFEHIATRCLQAKQSLDTNGAGDSYQLWYLGWITLLAFCEDGDDFIHLVSSAHPKYAQANVDAHFTQAQHEIATKGLGPPTCAALDLANPGVCAGCPFRVKVKSPIALGYPADPLGDLPQNYRRTGTHIEGLVGQGKTQRWAKLMPGDVTNPWLEQVTIGGQRLHFEYLFGGEVIPINALAEAVSMGGVAIVQHLTRLGITATKLEFERIGDFLVAWIKQLRDRRVINRDGLRPFGWTHDEQGRHLGFAVAGTHYLADGSEQMIAAGDATIASYYRPAGDYSEWLKPGALFQNSEPAAQLIIATAFAAPLISLASMVKGVSWNFWSSNSGVQKTAAMDYAQSVWGDPVQKSSQSDTYNAVVNLLGTTRVLPRYWDDMLCDDKESQETFNALVRSITQGAEKNRLSASAQLQRRHEWETMLVISSNRSLSDLLAANDTTDSGYQRLIQVKFERQATPHNAQVGLTLNLIKNNYGHAGRIYAKHIAMHHDPIQQEIVESMDVLGQKFSVQQAERHFVTAMACILVGARHAEKLGLFTFDHRGMLNCMRLSLGDLRSATGAQVLVGNTGVFDHVEVLARYAHYEAARRVRTDILGTPGSMKPNILGSPTANNINVQIAQRAAILRINRSDFRKWMTANNIPANDLIKQISQLPNVRQTREHIGGGTPWATVKLWVLDIPLVGPLASFLDSIDQQPIHGLTHLQNLRQDAPTSTP
jgi:hypothetical protein